ncbi:uncharacterized protein [Procambarus clarkii]|uniref:uncharacterized protein n=1 Tax=Procambarus clarkii TaxID=6728 RepID=UPI001E6707DC|nr:uncharacterized protein LOC123745391 [Procambarus clarkii]
MEWLTSSESRAVNDNVLESPNKLSQSLSDISNVHKPWVSNGGLVAKNKYVHSAKSCLEARSLVQWDSSDASTINECTTELEEGSLMNVKEKDKSFNSRTLAYHEGCNGQELYMDDESEDDMLNHLTSSYVDQDDSCDDSPLNKSAFSLNSTLELLEDFLISPFRRIHDKVRKKLQTVASPIKYEHLDENGNCIKFLEDEKETSCIRGILQCDTVLDDESPLSSNLSSPHLDSTMQFSEDASTSYQGALSNDCILGVEKSFDVSVNNAIEAEEEDKTPRAPWNSPVLDTEETNYKTPKSEIEQMVSWHSPLFRKLINSPLLNKFEAKSEGYLCHIHAPSWLVWRPKMQAFICNFENKDEIKLQVDLMLEEPNPEEHFNIVRGHDNSAPEVGEERILYIPRGMVWVRTSSSGFLTTRARLEQLTLSHTLPSTWRVVSRKTKVTRLKKSYGKYLHL